MNGRHDDSAASFNRQPGLGGAAGSLGGVFHDLHATTRLAKGTAPTVTPAHPPNTPLAWQAHPARERPLAALGAVTIMAAMAAACWSAAGGWWGLLAVVVLVTALNRFFLPSRFVIDDDGVTAHYLLTPQHYPWSSIRRMHHDDYGVYLSSRVRPSRRDAFRGLHLLFGSGPREEVLTRLRARVGTPSDRPGGTPCGG